MGVSLPQECSTAEQVFEEEEEEGLFKPDAVNEEDPSATATLDIKVLVNYFGEPQGPAKRLRVLIQ